ncbi:MAG: YqgE/AlgH family protein [Cytophagaceae bacterium]|jgi:putative transcriptional regulator|nr:YqgE/AlgH family protein [Cytophagaceae bacterium]
MESFDMNIFKIAPHKTLLPARGHILISDPFLQGPYFSRSVVLITEHNEEGTIGFVLNKPTRVYPDEIIDDILSFNGVFYVGGPVSTNSFHVLHTLGDLVPGSIRVTSTVYWGGDFNAVKRLINNKVANSDSVKFFVGYSGWVSGQLDSEIEEDAWVVSTLDDAKIMQSNSDHSWHETLTDLGEDFKTWLNFPLNPSFN